MRQSLIPLFPKDLLRAVMSTRRLPLVQVQFARHFALLGGTVALLIAAGSRGRPAQTSAAFGWFGALHATLFVLSLRDRHGGLPAWPRALSFIVLAAALAVTSATLTVWGIRSLPVFAGVGGAGAGLIVAVCSAWGAMSYSLLIRGWWHPDLEVRAIVAITGGCVLATLVALWAGVLFWTNGRLWFAVFWWFTLSAGLWIEDLRRSMARRAARG